MRFSLSTSGALLGAFAALVNVASAGRLLKSSSLETCMENSGVTASIFDVVYTPNNQSLNINIVGTSTVTGNVTIDVRAHAYGLSVYKERIDPCTSNLLGMCPMASGPLTIQSQETLNASEVGQIPWIAYTIPDLQASVTIYINNTYTGEALACVQADLSNGQSVYVPAVCWVLAVITGLGLVAAAVASGLGHSNTAAHVAANTLSLFGYFQGQAFLGMTAVLLPPIVASWTQDFAWSMGIIRVGFLQTLATWYQRATGGTASILLAQVQSSEASVSLEKRTVQGMANIVKRSLVSMAKRSTTSANANQVIVVKGIDRVGWRAGIEETNIFMTGYIFFLIFILFVVLAVVVFKLICEGLVRAGRMKGDAFIDFRNGWTTVLKGIMYRVALIGFPQMVVLCFWEFTQRDSAAIVLLAAFVIVTLLVLLGWAASKVIRLARRSINMHKNPAYILYSDPVTLNKWGFLYISYKATAYYWLVCALAYIFIKGLFVGLAQGSYVTQAIAFLVIDAVYLVVLCIFTPYMDKKTNGFNISIQVINFINSVFLLVFTSIFNQPGIVNGAMGIIYFIYNAVFAFVLLIMLLVASGFALFHKNPDVRYAPMRDDRGSFIKSSTNLPNELDALGATARGEGRFGESKNNLDIDEDGYSSSDVSRLGPNGSRPAVRYGDSLVPGSPDTTYSSGMFANEKQGAYYDPVESRSGASSPAPGRGAGRKGPWQRGAGYE